ncbi:MAG: methyltransferase domain-containing protein [Treponema sp.]|nr:methyltransferase domain-containing protein [Treponema sp.]
MQNILFSIDSLVSNSTPTNPYVEFRGWAFSKTSELKQIRISYNGKCVEAKLFTPRHDVAVAFPDFADKAENSGFYKLISLSKGELLAGVVFTLEVVAYDDEVCTQQVAITPITEQQYEDMSVDDSICTCSFCGETSHFGNSGFDYPIFHKYKIIGGGARPNTYCQLCGSNDRIRYLDYVLSNYTDIYRAKNKILHIAPEKIIEAKIRSNKNCNYITGDIQEGVADCKVDVTRMQFPDNHFDFIMLNHVFEHIPDEAAAVSEIKRCLKKNGKLIFSVPICLERNTFEDPSYTTAEERIKFYGQADHVRLYGANDIVERFERYGLKVTEYMAEKILPVEKIAEMRVIAKDRIFIAKKVNSLFLRAINRMCGMRFEN